jgi:hypothetical protein
VQCQWFSHLQPTQQLETPQGVSVDSLGVGKIEIGCKNAPDDRQCHQEAPKHCLVMPTWPWMMPGLWQPSCVITGGGLPSCWGHGVVLSLSRRLSLRRCAVHHRGFITACMGTAPGPWWPPCIIAGGHPLSLSCCGGGVVLVVALMHRFDVARFCATSGHSPVQREVGGHVWRPWVVVVTVRDHGCHGAGGVYVPIGRHVLLRSARHGGHSGLPFSSLWWHGVTAVSQWHAVATSLVVVAHVRRLNVARLCTTLGHSLVGRVAGGTASTPGSSWQAGAIAAIGCWLCV